MTRRAALALLLWGCGSVGGSSGGGVEVVRLAHRARGPEVSVAESLLDRYRNLNPGLQVAQLAAATNAGYRERLFKSLSTGTPPDAFLLDHGDVPAAIERGWLLDLAPYLSRAGVDQEAFNPAVLAIFRRGSALYALPRGYSPVVVAYNKDLFDRAGLPYPTDDWTWDDFLRVARLLTRDNDGDGEIDQWGTSFERGVAAWLPWLWSGGGDVLCADGRRASGCLDSPTTIAALRWYTGWVTTERVAPPPTGRPSWSGTDLGAFANGGIAMVTVVHGAIPSSRPPIAARGLRVGFVELPHRAGFAPATALYASGYAVPRVTLRRRLAIELAASLADSLAAATRGDAGLELPAVTAAAVALVAQDTSGREAAFLRAAAHGRVPWSARVERWPELEAVLPDLMDRVLGGGRPEAAARDMARRLDRLLGAAR